MKKYLGVKLVNAELMSFNERQKECGIKEFIDNDRDGYKVVYEDGYTSWSPKDVFEKAYRETSDCDSSLISVNQKTGEWNYIGSSNLFFTFGDAIELLKKGKKVARIGWNGKGMWLVLAYPSYTDGRMSEVIKFNCVFKGVESHLENFIAMKTCDNKLVTWLASQTDMLSEDWVIVE